MPVSTSGVNATDLLRIPRREFPGNLLDRGRSITATSGWVSKILRVGRKRYISRIKSPQRDVLIAEILRHECGQEFQKVLHHWSRTASVTDPFPLSGVQGSPCLHEEHAKDVNSGPPFGGTTTEGDAATTSGKRDTPSTADSHRCSVIINTVDRAKDLEMTLEAMKAEWDPARDELIVVLGVSGDDSAEVIGRSPVPCRLIHCPERNLAVSRNLGLEAATGRFVAFIDDDASPAPGWLDALLAPLEEDPEVGISAGFVLDGIGARFLNRFVVADTLGRAFWMDDEESARLRIEELGPQRAFLTATGCNMAFRRGALDGIGGFDPFYSYFLEETDAVWRILNAGFRCVVSPESRVLHRLGANIARQPSFEIASRAVIVRSQIHYIGKFGKPTRSPGEIESCVWERVLLDLEKIAWDCSGSAGHDSHCGELQERYLSIVADELRLDSPPE